jgi:hypothetical protein
MIKEKRSSSLPFSADKVETCGTCIGVPLFFNSTSRLRTHLFDNYPTF